METAAAGLALPRFGDKRPLVASLASSSPSVSPPEVPFCARADSAGVSPSECGRSWGKRRRVVVHFAAPQAAALPPAGPTLVPRAAASGLGLQGHAHTQAALGPLPSPSSSLRRSQKLPGGGRKLRLLRYPPGRGSPHELGSWVLSSSLSGRVLVCVAIREAQEPSCDHNPHPHGSFRGFPWFSGVKQVRGSVHLRTPLYSSVPPLVSCLSP